MTDKVRWTCLYAQHLAQFDYGEALWEPSPQPADEEPIYDRIEVGDVGLLDEGSWTFLFNVFLRAEDDHQKMCRGLPPGFEPLYGRSEDMTAAQVLSRAAEKKSFINTMPLVTENVTYKETSGSAAVQIALGSIPPVEVGTCIEFQFSSQSGAVLAFRKPARRYRIGKRDILLKRHFKRHYKAWTRFVEELGYDVSDGLLIVTGVVRTPECGMAVWRSSDSSFAAEAKLTLPGIAGASMKRKWESTKPVIVLHNHAPQHEQDPTIQPPDVPQLPGEQDPDTEPPDAQPLGASQMLTEQNLDLQPISSHHPDLQPQSVLTLPDNQTIFIQTIQGKGAFARMTDKVKRLFPSKLRAAAGYDDLGPGDRDANTSPQVAVQDDGYDGDEIEIVYRNNCNHKDVSVISPLLDYILVTCPQADVAFAESSDLMPYLEGHYDEERIKKRLHLFAPEIEYEPDDGVATLKHQPYSFMVRKLLEQGVEYKPQTAQELLSLADRITDLAPLIPGNILAARHLGEWCSEVVFFVTRIPYVNKDHQPLAEGTRIIREIERNLKHWNHDMCRAVAIAISGQILDRIQEYHMEIHSYCGQWEVQTQSRIEDTDGNDLDAALEEMTRKDHEEVLKQLCGEATFSSMVTELQLSPNEQIRGTLHELSRIMQESLSDFQLEDERRTSLERNLYAALQHSGELLPSLDLRRGEVQRVGSKPRYAVSQYSVWDGTYLSSEKVAMKVFRSYASSNPESSEGRNQYRFQREAKIWLETWQKDRGRYLVPFYGYCTTDGSNPYLVSPFYEQTAMQYVRGTPDADHIAILCDVARGIEVLHTFPFIHGNIKGENIFIQNGHALLGNFGFSKLMEDVMGETFTQNDHSSSAVRWRSPERWQGHGILSIQGDIYEFGMTMFELFTHAEPFKAIKSNTDIMATVTSGKRPARPTDPDIIRRGLTDAVWSLMEDCWKQERGERPDIASVLAVLESARKS